MPTGIWCHTTSKLTTSLLTTLGQTLQRLLSKSYGKGNLKVEKLVGITTDSSSNIKLACDLLNWNNFGHNLNLEIEQCKGANTFRVYRNAVSAFSTSWKKQQDLVVSQEQRELPIHKPKRWFCIRHGRKTVGANGCCEKCLSEDKVSAHLSPSWQDQDILQSIADALKRLKTITDALSAEKFVNISAVKSLLSHLTEEVLVAEDNDTDLTK